MGSAKPNTGAEITAMPGREALRPVWRLQWADDHTIKTWNGNGTVFLTMDRLGAMLKEAQQHGWKSGEQAGRWNLRVGIENGTLEPIRPREGQ